ncbi:MAG: hypothetical protein O6933_06390 [Planctomycetota bacterium]|nr:hypothetical protein [Planctomycetota bacterium]
MRSHLPKRWSQTAAACTLAIGGAAQAQIVNGSFETSDFSGWVTVDLNVPFFPMMVGPAGISPGFGFFLSNPTDGVFAALHGWDGDGPGGPPDAIKIAQDVVLPAGAAEIQFDYRAAWDKTFGATLPREFRVDIEPFGGGPFLQRDVLLIADPGTTVSDTGDLVGIVDVSSFSGSPVRISFEWVVPETFTGPAFFQLDNVLLIEVPVADSTLDIKPGSCPNSFNRNSHGVLPVALVGAKDFDVNEVDLSSILLSRADGIGGSVAPNEGPPGPHSVFADVATPFEGKEPCDCHDLEGDGILDLSMKFITDDMVEALQLDDLPAGDLIQLVVNGTLLDGTPFSASDCIRLVPPGTPPGVMAVGSNLSGVYIDVTPLDETLDGGGFANFNRTYWLGTIVTLTAPQTHLGWVFAGWSDNAGFGSLTTSDDAGPLPDPSIDIIIVDNQISVEAIYTPPVRGNSL